MIRVLWPINICFDTVISLTDEGYMICSCNELPQSHFMKALGGPFHVLDVYGLIF